MSKVRSLALTTTSLILTFVPYATAFADDHEGRERGVRIDRDFDASHPIEWIAIGVALSAAIVLAYVAGKRRRDK